MAASIKTWHTGRLLYDGVAQTMYARVQKDGTIVFADITRLVYGRILLDRSHKIAGFNRLRDCVMRQYDSGNYLADRVSRRFFERICGMALGGINT